MKTYLHTHTIVYRFGIQIRIVIHTNTRVCPRTLAHGVTTTITITTSTILLLRPLMPQLEPEHDFAPTLCPPR